MNLKDYVNPKFHGHIDYCMTRVQGSETEKITEKLLEVLKDRASIEVTPFPRSAAKNTCFAMGWIITFKPGVSVTFKHKALLKCNVIGCWSGRGRIGQAFSKGYGHEVNLDQMTEELYKALSRNVIACWW